MVHLFIAAMWLFLLAGRCLRLPRVPTTAQRMAVAYGQGLVEYSLIIALLAIVVIGSLSAVGKSTNDAFGRVQCSLSGKEWHSDNGQGNSNRCR